MYQDKIRYGDLVYIHLDDYTLYYTPNLRNLIFVTSCKAPETAFRNAIFQILPSNFNPFERKLFESMHNLLESTESLALQDSPIKTGDSFLLYHYESRNLLYSVEDKKYLKELGIGLTKNPENASLFKFSSPEGSNSEVSYGDKIYIQHCHENYFLNAEEEEDSQNFELNSPNSYTRTTTDFPKVVPRRNPLSNLEKSYVALLSNQPGHMHLEKFQDIESLHKNPDIIHNSDYVRIRYNDQWLSFYQNQEKRQEAYFERVTNHYQPFNYTHTIFQVIKGNKGESLNTKDEYLIKHFMSGFYLHYKSAAMLKMFNNIMTPDNYQDEQAYCTFETENQENEIREKNLLRIKYVSTDGYNAYVKPTEPMPIKNVQFEMNTLYFFGFKVPEEYSYKNLKCLQRTLAETNTAFETEGHGIVIEKVDPDEMYCIYQCEAFANELQRFVDIISVPNLMNKEYLANQQLSLLIQRCEELLSQFYRKEKLNPNSIEQPRVIHKIKIPNRFFQSLVREFRIFDLIHIINFLLIKKNSIGEDFETATFLELYKLFAEILLSSLDENIFNRFYNSQYIRIYIHFMSEECEGVFTPADAHALRDSMRYTTLELLKEFLWDEDLDGLGQLNFYQNMMFTAIRQTTEFQTYYLELVEHISSSKAYNLTNSFRDEFIAAFMSQATEFQSLFPIIYIKDEELWVKFVKHNLTMKLNSIMDDQNILKYFTVALRMLTALSSSHLMTYYHAVIKNYPLKTLQAVLNAPDIDLSIKELCHMIILYAYFNYLKLPFQYIPSTIQTASDDLRALLNQEEIKIMDACKTVIGLSERLHLEKNGIINEVMDNISHLNAQDCSIQINLIQKFNEEEPNYYRVKLTLFYIDAVIANGNINIHFLNKAKDALIKIRNFCNSDGSEGFHLLPRILETFSIINQKMKEHSSNAIYMQVIKTNHPNTQEYSRKIIAGLKKIHYESFAPLDMLALNEPKISSPALRYLRTVAIYEQKIAEELEKFVILSSEKEVQSVKRVIELTLILNQEVRRYLVQKENTKSIKCFEGDFVKHINNLEELLAIIYNPEEHFRYKESQLPNSINKLKTRKERFFELLRKEKTPIRDRPFKVNEKAISKLQQNIFRVLSVHNVLLQFLNCSVTLTVEGKTSNSPADIYLPRLLLIILTAFTYKNKTNQNILAHSHGFISLYYQQKYIDKSCDSLTLFAEVMRDNETLLEINKKFIYDITCYTFLGTIKPRMINKESGAYLCTAIMSMHYLYKANVPKVIYDSFSVAESKFNNILVEDFSKLSLIPLIKEKGEWHAIEMISGYYNITEMIRSTIYIVKEAFKDEIYEEIERFRNIFKCQKIVDALCLPGYRTQFEIKDLFLKLLNKLNFSKKLPNPHFLESDKEATKKFIIFLINELEEYLLLGNKMETDEHQNRLAGTFLEEVAKDYALLRNYNLLNIRQLLFLDELPVKTIWERLYIYSECWKFLGRICLKYPHLVEDSSFESFLQASKQLTKNADNVTFPVLGKLKKYLLGMMENTRYKKYEQQIRSLVDIITAKFESLSQEHDLNDTNSVSNAESPSEKGMLQTIISHIKANQEKDEYSNLEQFCESVKKHPNKNLILSELLSVIEHNPTNLHRDIYTFITKFLKIYLKKSLPQVYGKTYDESLYGSFYETQNDLLQLNASARLLKGINIVENSTNLASLFELLLTFSRGYNPKAIESLKRSINKARYVIIPSEPKYKVGNELWLFLLKKLLEKGNLDKELEKFFQYCCKNYCTQNTDKLDSIEKLDQFNSKLKQVCDLLKEKDIKEINGNEIVIPINFFTVSELFKIRKEDDPSVASLKSSLIKAIQSSPIESILNGFLKNIKQYSGLEGFDPLKIQVILILELLVSQIKSNIVSLEED